MRACAAAMAGQGAARAAEPLLSGLLPRSPPCGFQVTTKEGELKMRMRLVLVVATFFSAALLFQAAPAFAQSSAKDGKLHVHVSPKQAYVFVDGKAIRDGSQTIDLSAGSHSIGIDNYGYTPQTKNVDITAGKTTDLDVTLVASGDKVNGPFGDIELKGHPRAAVLLDGTTPAYFVGHIDEFDNNFGWHQWLLVKPGTYQLTATQ